MGGLRRFRPLCGVLLAIQACAGTDPPASSPAETPPAAAAVPETPTKAATSSSELPAVTGARGQNNILALEVTRAGFGPAGQAAPAGLRHYTVELRGISRVKADVSLEFRPFVFLQDERGCISRPQSNVQGLTRPFSESAAFSSKTLIEGQLAFLVPEDTRQVRLLVAPAKGDGIIVPAGPEFQPAWPAPIHTIDDGTTLRVHVLPTPAAPPALPKPPAGHDYIVLDVVVENLKATQGIEFQTSQQLRLIGPGKAFVQPAPVSGQLPCRLEDGDLVPPGHARRLMVVYELPIGAPRRLQYRGFEKDEATVDLQ
jgi:hypothetical protein